MPDDNVDLIRTANAAFNRGDIEAFLAMCVDDVQIEDLNNAPDLPPVSRGIDEVRETLTAWIDAFDDFRGEIEEYIEAGDRVACVVRYHGKSRASGLTIDQRIVDVWEFRDGRLVRGTLGYSNRDAALEAMEQDPASFGPPAPIRGRACFN
jgi:ketosteroid isomerase-like protein